MVTTFPPSSRTWQSPLCSLIWQTNSRQRPHGGMTRPEWWYGDQPHNAAFARCHHGGNGGVLCAEAHRAWHVDIDTRINVSGFGLKGRGHIPGLAHFPHLARSQLFFCRGKQLFKRHDKLPFQRILRGLTPAGMGQTYFAPPMRRACSSLAFCTRSGFCKRSTAAPAITLPAYSMPL